AEVVGTAGAGDGLDALHGDRHARGFAVASRREADLRALLRAEGAGAPSGSGPRATRAGESWGGGAVVLRSARALRVALTAPPLPRPGGLGTPDRRLGLHDGTACP